ERPPPDQKLVRDHAERKHLAPRIGGLALGLLGRHVRRRADDVAHARERRAQRRRPAQPPRPRGGAIARFLRAQRPAPPVRRYATTPPRTASRAGRRGSPPRPRRPAWPARSRAP